jgi:hypothetical protein
VYFGCIGLIMGWDWLAEEGLPPLKVTLHQMGQMTANMLITTITIFVCPKVGKVCLSFGHNKHCVL